MTFTGSKTDVVRFVSALLKRLDIALVSITITIQGKSAASCAVTATDIWSEDIVREMAMRNFLVRLNT